MSTFVLVHGAFHGAWCWSRVTPLLERAGHRVVTLDLPGHGADPTPSAHCTLAGYAAAVAEVVRAQPEPVILVGHSFGGEVISQAAELVPEAICRLVYLSALLLRPGESMTSALGPLIMADGGKTLALDLLHGQLLLRPETAPLLFFQDCPLDETAWALRQVTPEPLLPLATPVAVSDARFGRVPRCYLECSEDLVIPVDLQRSFVAATPCETVRTLPTGHSPFLSAPAVVAEQLASLA